MLSVFGSTLAADVVMASAAINERAFFNMIIFLSVIRYLIFVVHELKLMILKALLIIIAGSDTKKL